MAQDIYPVVLCGGSGTRLWPVSRQRFPKQFSNFLGRESLFQACVRRLQGKGFFPPVVLTHEDFRFLAGEQLDQIDVSERTLLVEPEGRNTAPAILSAALHIGQTDKDALMMIAPSDHVIPDRDVFLQTVTLAKEAALNGQIVAFGIRPTRAETGYGYLELATKTNGATSGAVPLSSFVEKPDISTAQSMLTSGRFLWNAGLFLASARTILTAFQLHAPEFIAPVRRALRRAEPDLGFVRLDPESWASLPDLSIDYAVMEKADNLVVVPFEGRWSDMGDWNAVWREGPADDAGVVRTGAVRTLDCTDSLIQSTDHDMAVIGIGLKDTVVVATSDAVLVADKSRAQELKQAVQALRDDKAPQADGFARDYRPWGWFDRLATADRFQVKRIHINPGAALSLQSHEHRSEHWIVVQGTARVLLDGKEMMVEANQSVYVPRGATHRLSNPTKDQLILIEVQTGSYLGEDDIVRYEDDYFRS